MQKKNGVFTTCGACRKRVKKIEPTGHCTDCEYEINLHGMTRRIYLPSGGPTREIMKELIAVGILAVMLCIGMSDADAHTMQGIASFYGIEACKFNPDPMCPTASGKSLYKLIRNNDPYVAMYGPAFGSKLRIKGPNGTAEGIVFDRGPNKRLNRIADLSPELFQTVCGNLKRGLCSVEIEVIN